jgi:hypothetical protein
MAWTLTLRDDHGDVTTLRITREQAERFMAGEQGIAYWSSAPESIAVDPDTDWLHEHHSACLVEQEEDYPRG